MSAPLLSLATVVSRQTASARVLPWAKAVPAPRRPGIDPIRTSRAVGPCTRPRGGVSSCSRQTDDALAAVLRNSIRGTPPNSVVGADGLHRVE